MLVVDETPTIVQRVTCPQCNLGEVKELTNGTTGCTWCGRTWAIAELGNDRVKLVRVGSVPAGEVQEAECYRRYEEYRENRHVVEIEEEE